MESWPCHFPLNYWRYFTGAHQEGGRGVWCGFIVGENTSEGPWHSNAQGFTACAIGQRRGVKKNRSNSGLKWERRSSNQFGITKIHHTHTQNENQSIPIQGFPFSTAVTWMTTIAETLQRLHAVSWHCTYNDGNCHDTDSQTNNQIKQFPTAAEKYSTGKQTMQLTWNPFKRTLYQEWVIWASTSPPYTYNTQFAPALVQRQAFCKSGWAFGSLLVQSSVKLADADFL